MSQHTCRGVVSSSVNVKPYVFLDKVHGLSLPSRPRQSLLPEITPSGLILDDSLRQDFVLPSNKERYVSGSLSKGDSFSSQEQSQCEDKQLPDNVDESPDKANNNDVLMPTYL